MNTWYLSQDQLKTRDFRKEREGGSCHFKTGESEHMQKGRGKWIWLICYGRQLIVFKSPDKCISSTKTVITNIKICFVWKSSTIIFILLWMLDRNFPSGKYKCSQVHWSLLDNRFSKLKKKKLDGKFSKPLVKNFQIWLLLLKETFFDAPNTSDMHSNNLNFVSSERG